MSDKRQKYNSRVETRWCRKVNTTVLNVLISMSLIEINVLYLMAFLLL